MSDGMPAEKLCENADCVGTPQGILLLISGPSGAGKSTVIRSLFAREKRLPLKLHFSLSVTTRPRRAGEQNGREYHFVTPEEMDTLLRRDGLLEYAPYAGHIYGTPAAPVAEWLAMGDCVVADMEVQGVAQVKAKLPDAVSVFLVPPSRRILEMRLRGRATESEEDIRRRMAIASEEMRHLERYDYVVYNDEVDDAVRELEAILQAEVCRRRVKLNCWEEM